MVFWLCCLLSLLCLSLIIDAQTPTPTLAPTPPSNVDCSSFKIILFPGAPFIFPTQNSVGKYYGYAVEVLNIALKELGCIDNTWNYTLFTDTDEAIYAMSTGQFHMAIAPIPVTSQYESVFDMTHPYYVGSLSIASKYEAKELSLLIFERLFGPTMINMIAGLFIVCFILAHIYWKVEINNKAGYLDNIAASIYWAFQTISTLGYGDECPNSGKGHLVVIVATLTGA